MGRRSVFFITSQHPAIFYFFFENTEIKESCLINLRVLVGALCHLVIFKPHNLFCLNNRILFSVSLCRKIGGSGLITKNHGDRFCEAHMESSLIEAETVTWYPIISANSSPFFELFELYFFFPPRRTSASLSPLSLLLSLSSKCQGLRLISKKTSFKALPDDFGGFASSSWPLRNSPACPLYMINSSPTNRIEIYGAALCSPPNQFV